eukprot:1519565-Prymnesium_polylepis.1
MSKKTSRSTGSAACPGMRASSSCCKSFATCVSPSSVLSNAFLTTCASTRRAMWRTFLAPAATFLHGPR